MAATTAVSAAASSALREVGHAHERLAQSTIAGERINTLTRSPNHHVTQIEVAFCHWANPVRQRHNTPTKALSVVLGTAAHTTYLARLRTCENAEAPPPNR